MRDWFLRVAKKAGKLLLYLLGFLILIPIAVWFDSARETALTYIFGKHEGFLWGVFYGALGLLVYVFSRAIAYRRDQLALVGTAPP